MKVITFDQALAATSNVKRHLLLGNGFSMAFSYDCFSYVSLLGAADFSACPEARTAFDLLGTTDFEVVLDALRKAVTLLPLYVEAVARQSRIVMDVSETTSPGAARGSPTR